MERQLSFVSVPNIGAKPFLKWAGGKRQLIPQLDKTLPHELKVGKLKRYIEPFIGGGALLFHILQNYEINEIYIGDSNPELVIAYKVVQAKVEKLINLLSDIETNYLPLGEDRRKIFYYEMRASFNEGLHLVNFQEYEEAWCTRVAQLIFLNRTCFNGLFRVNAKGEFNVPMGKYKNPKICDASNLRLAALLLKDAIIERRDFEEWADVVDSLTFVYFDPPYRPISTSSSFTSYSRDVFDDREQLRLANFFRELDELNAKLMLSNSDPKNNDATDDFFEDAFSGYEIKRILANRNINSKAKKRGAINEILVMNYLQREG